MIAYIEGTILIRRDKFIIVKVNGVGYQVFLSRKTLRSLSETQDSVKLFCYHNIKEDASDLYGFLTYDELDFFETLNEIHGVGPKAALEISVLGSLDKIKTSILAEDTKIFEGIPGIGAKKAMTIILELTGKIKMLDGQKSKGSADPAEDGLIQLGFSKAQVKETLLHIDKKLPLEERIRVALKSLGKN